MRKKSRVVYTPLWKELSGMPQGNRGTYMRRLSFTLFQYVLGHGDIRQRSEDDELVEKPARR